MTNHIDELDFGWLLEDFVELSLDELPDDMWEFHYKTGPERGAIIMETIERVAAELPRTPETTDEQHAYDAFIELSRRYHAYKTRLPTASARVDLASRAMATIRDADENARRTRRGRPPRSSNDAADPKLRATTEVILSMPVDDRLRQLEAESSFFSSIRPLDG